MAILTLSEILEKVTAIIPDSTTDDALTFIEDITDTLNAKNDNDNENWKERYEENDRTWRERYKNRFLTGDPQIDSEIESDTPAEKEYKFEDLFKEG